MTVTLLTGDCLAVLRTLPANSVQTCVTSPPYWGLRDYNAPGQIGLEKDPREYIAKLVEVFAEVRRVLRTDGTLWLNMGDSYTDGGRGDDTGSTLLGARRNQRESRRTRNREHARPFGLGTKQLVGMPWRVAFALQESGWYLRRDIIWHKPNPMPESAKDRPTAAHEYLFLFSKRARYFYDADAIKEPVSGGAHARGAGVNPKAKTPSGWETGVGRSHRALEGRYSETRAERPQSRLRMKQNASFSAAVAGLVATRNKRDVWTIPSHPYKGAHFATFPPKLVMPCILAGTAPRACELCGTAWKRQSVCRTTFEGGSGRSGGVVAGKHGVSVQGGGATGDLRLGPVVHSETVGWKPRCECSLASGVGRCVVLDPFGGSGTTGMVATELGRDAVLIELSDEYLPLIRTRCGLDAPAIAEGA